MKICMTKTAMKTCDLELEDCTRCVPGPYVTVPYLTMPEFYDSTDRQHVELVELFNVECGLRTLERCSKLGDTNKNMLRDLISRMSEALNAIGIENDIVRGNLAYQCALADQEENSEQ